MAELGDAAVTFTTSDSWDSCIDTIEEFYRKGWTDGLPVIPPTPDLIQRMVERCGRDPQEVLGPVPPRMGLATVETVAANAVMAGCRPDYFPVVLAVVEAALDARFNLNGLQATTHPAGPLVIISGPVVKDLDINYGTSAFGPGFRSNATIGRALRLVMMVLGGGYPETGDKSVLGSPGKYIYCIGESPDAPWGPLHRDFGVDSPSGVTLLGCDSPVQYGGAQERRRVPVGHGRPGPGLLAHDPPRGRSALRPQPPCGEGPTRRRLVEAGHRRARSRAGTGTAEAHAGPQPHTVGRRGA